MLITPAQLVKQALPLNEKVPAGSITYADDVRQVGPLAVKGKAELIIEDRGRGQMVNDIRLRGTYSGNFEQLCARCVEPVAQALSGEFDLIFRPAGVDAEAGERAISEEETEIGYYGESGLLLEDALREQVLLTLPARALCKEDCQGICSHCGQNRNAAPCSCDQTTTDQRWNALAGLSLK